MIVALKMLKFQDVYLLITIAVIISWWKRTKEMRLAAKIPGINGLPLVGILPKMIGVKFEGKVDIDLRYKVMIAGDGQKLFII